MTAVRPPVPADTSELNNVQGLAVLSVPPHSRVLGVTRGDSLTGRLLVRRDCWVAEVEVDGQSPSFVAPQWATLVTPADVEAADTKVALAEETFDAILMLDVFGYLWDPSGALAWARGRLRPGGRLITSFGNVTHGAVRLSMLRGEFPYADAGLLDRARVRFYDRRGAETLLLDAGLRIDQRLRVTRDFEGSENLSGASSSPAEIVAALRRDPEATTYEFVFVSSHANPGISAPDASLAERLQRRVQEVEAARCSAEEQASQDRQRAQELEAELRRRMEELHVRQHERRQLQDDIATREAFIAQFRAQAVTDRSTMDALRAELQQVRALLDVERTEAQQARTLLDAARADAQRARAEGDRVRAELSALHALAASASYRLVKHVILMLRRYERIYSAVRSIVRTIAPPSPGAVGDASRTAALPLPPVAYQTLVCGQGSESTFEEVGQWLVALLKRYDMVGAGTVFLDVGCGCGRVACFLMAEPVATYAGFDRHPGMIAWCTEVLAPVDSRFCFEHAAIRSVYSIRDGYAGEIDADRFVFPYPSERFDSILLASVFTHMPFHEVCHYLGELKRVLAPRGKVLLSTFFSNNGPERMNDIDFFHDPTAFLTAVAAVGFIAQADSPHLLYGYQHNWYLLTHAA